VSPAVGILGAGRRSRNSTGTVLSGDDAGAKSEVAALFDDAGFSVIALGGLAMGARSSRSAARSRASTSSDWPE
jgi:predicted dinucleotide-binding enzyme